MADQWLLCSWSKYIFSETSITPLDNIIIIFDLAIYYLVKNPLINGLNLSG